MLFTFGSTFAKDRVSKHTTVKGDLMSITYGQPNKKGRVIFGGLEPFDKVWRTGADEATEVTFNKNVTFGGKKVKAGTYTLFTKPGRQKWDIILNSKLGQWGAYEYDNTKDVVTVTSPVKQLDKVVETFSIEIMKTGINMAWDQTSVFVEVKAD